MGKLCKIIVKDKSLKMSEATCGKKIRDYDNAHAGNACSAIAKNKTQEKADCYRGAITKLPNSDNGKPFSLGFAWSWLSNIPTPIMPGGSGWDSRITLGPLALSYSPLTTQNKLLPAGTTNLTGTSEEGSSWMLSIGSNTPEYSALNGGSLFKVSQNDTHIVYGRSSIGGASYDQFGIRKETTFGPAYSSGNFLIQPFIGLSLASVKNFNKHDDTLRDYSRIMALRYGIALSYGGIPTDDSKSVAMRSGQQKFNYFYSDFTSLLATWIDSSTDQDIANTKLYIDKAIGPQEASTAPSATSEVPTLLLGAFFFSAKESGKKRSDFYKMDSDWKNIALAYQGARVLALGLLTASEEQSASLAPAAVSSARNLLDLWVLRHSDTPKQAMLYHLAIGGGMMALGALGHDSAFGKALSLAGHEGISATAMSPDAFDSKKWISNTRYEYHPLSSYSRAGVVGSIDSELRPSFHIQTTFHDTAFYIAASAATPMGDIRGIGGRTSSFVTSSEGTVKYANTDIDIPAAMANTLGLQASTASKGSIVSVHGNVGAGPQLEWNSAGIEAGLMGEIGAGIDFHPSESWSLGASARCSATKFMDGHATDCSVGLGLSFSEQKK